MADEINAFAEPSDDWSNGTINPEEYELMLADLLTHNLLQETKDGHYQYTNTFFSALKNIIEKRRSISSKDAAIIMRYCQARINTTSTIKKVTISELTNHKLNKQYDRSTQNNVCSCAKQVNDFIVTGIIELMANDYCKQHKESSTSIANIVDSDEDNKDEKLLKLKS